MLHKHLIALYDGVFLVFQIHHSFWQRHGEVVFHLVAEGVDEHFDIDFVRRWLIVEIGVLFVFLNVVDSYLYAFVPELPEFVGAIFHVVVVFHRHVEFVARRLSRS